MGNDLDLSGGNVEATGDVILVANAGGDDESITFSGRTIDANTGNVFLSADSITFGTGLASTGSSGTTTVTIVGDAAASTITVAGGAGSNANLEISEAELATIGSTFSDVIIGMAAADGTIGGEAQSDQSGTITINAGDGTLNFSGANLNLRGVAATTTISSGINPSAAADRDVTIQGTTIDLDSGITTDSGNLTFTGPVNVNGTAALDTGNAGGSTTAGNVTFTGIVYANDGTGDGGGSGGGSGWYHSGVPP